MRERGNEGEGRTPLLGTKERESEGLLFKHNPYQYTSGGYVGR